MTPIITVDKWKYAAQAVESKEQSNFKKCSIQFNLILLVEYKSSILSTIMKIL